MRRLFQWFPGSPNPTFTQLYLAQTINLLGDALTWVALALLAFELAGEQSASVLAIALTVRVTVFVLVSPFAGVIADRYDRKRWMIMLHLLRMLVVCAFPWVNSVWQIYPIVLLLNVFSAGFTPTYKATIPLVTGKAHYSQAIALDNATGQLIGVLGPGLAGSVAAFVGLRLVFVLDGLTFLLAALLLLRLPTHQLNIQQSSTAKVSANRIRQIVQEIQVGTVCLFRDRLMRYALMVQLVAAIVGAPILVNTVGHIQGTLQLGKVEYGLVMGAFGLGATVAALSLRTKQTQRQKLQLVAMGALLMCMVLILAHFLGFGLTLLLWGMAGAAQVLVNLPTQMLIADRVAIELQGRVYGAHFAWSHLWWAIGYPVAGLFGTHFPHQYFLYGGLLGLILLGVIQLVVQPRRKQDYQNLLWHDHNHLHDAQHQHHAPVKRDGLVHGHLHAHLDHELPQHAEGY